MHLPDSSGKTAFSDRLFETAFTHAAIGMALVGLDGRYLKVNRALCEMVGYSEAELTALDFQTITHADDIDTGLELGRKLIAGELPNYQIEKRYLHKSGAIIWALLSATLVHQDDGSPDFVIAQMQDITARKAAEAQSELYFNQSADMMTMAGHDGYLQEVNGAWTAALGWTAEELTSRPYLDFVHPDDVVMTLAEAALASRGTPTPGFCNRYRAKDDSYHWLEWNTSLSLDARLFCCVRDITCRKQAEEQLRISEKRLHDIGVNIPGAVYQMVWRSDCKPYFLYLSDTTILGLDPKDVVRDSAVFIRTLHPDYRDKYIAQLAECSRTLSYRYWEGKNIDVHGNEVWIAISATPQPMDDGGVLWTGMLQDVTERKQLQLAVEHSEQLHRSLVQSLNEGVMVIDAQGAVLACNDSAEQILATSRDDLMQRNAFQSRSAVIREDNTPLPPEDWPIAVALKTGQPVRNIILGICLPSSELRWLSVNATPIAHSSQEAMPHTIVVSFHDVTEQKVLTRELENQAQTDFLTGACNRRQLFALAERELQRAQRYKSPFAVLLLDIDHFKRINDHYGHLVGDSVLQHLVEMLKQQLRDVDIIGRLGGEEFLVLLPETSEAPALEIAERLRQEIAAGEVLLDSGEQVRFTVSIGITAMRGGDNLNAIIRRADGALYRAKAQGRNQVCSAAPA